MAISSFFRKLSESDTEVHYAYGSEPDELHRELIIDKRTLRPRATVGAPTHGFHATALGIYRRRGPDGCWPERGYIAS